MRIRKVLLGTLPAFLLLLDSAPAHACGASLPPYWTFTGSFPADGATAVPRDVGIVLHATPWQDAAGPSFPLESLTLVTEDTGEEVLGSEVEWLPNPPGVAWSPSVPLQAGRSYVVSASIAQEMARPPEATGDDVISFRFTVSDVVTAPLELSGELTVSLARQEYPLYTNCDDCGTNCTASGTFTGVEARIRLPIVRGGQDSTGYEAWLHVTDDAPATFDGPGFGNTGSGLVQLPQHVHLQSDTSVELTQQLPMEDEPYRPCFALNVWDAAGHAVQAAPLCLADDEMTETFNGDAPLGMSGHSSQGSDSDGSCAIRSRNGAGPGRAAILFLSSVAAALARRRRRMI